MIWYDMIWYDMIYCNTVVYWSVARGGSFKVQCNWLGHSIVCRSYGLVNFRRCHLSHLANTNTIEKYLQGADSSMPSQTQPTDIGLQYLQDCINAYAWFWHSQCCLAACCDIWRLVVKSEECCTSTRCSQKMPLWREQKLSWQPSFQMRKSSSPDQGARPYVCCK